MNRTSILLFVALTVACTPPGPQIGADTSTDTMGESSTSSSDSTGFLPPGSDLPPSCDPFMQDCPEGEKCVPYDPAGNDWDRNKCVPVMGEQATGEPCTYSGIQESTDDCDATGFCWNAVEIDGELIGTCHAFCTGTADDPVCPEGSGCPAHGDGSVVLCIPHCDPVAQACAEEGTACYYDAGDFYCIPPADNLPPGAPCGYVNDCAGGSLCVNPESLPTCEGSACCTLFCQLDLGDAQCAAVPGTGCLPFFEDGAAPPELEHVGICIVPSP